MDKQINIIQIKLNWLSTLYYSIGKQTDMFLQIHTLPGKDKQEKCSKWKHYLYGLEPDNDWFLIKCNHRSVLTNEIVLDFDGKMSNVLFMSAIRILTKQHQLRWAAYNATNHLHIYDNELFMLNNVQRKMYKLDMIKRFHADEHKAIDRVMIACEYAPHWKRGQVKQYLTGNIY